MLQSAPYHDHNQRIKYIVDPMYLQLLLLIVRTIRMPEIQFKIFIRGFEIDKYNIHHSILEKWMIP